ncbi:MAG: YheU family protein [Rheinheimera sp.]|nr:YheU family protein [Rheinheimera sp.]
MLIPWQQINDETLQRLIESYVLREGTDYGAEEVSLADKANAVLQQIQRGQVLILYSELHESVDLLTRQQYQHLLQNDPATD